MQIFNYQLHNGMHKMVGFMWSAEHIITLISLES